MGEMSRLYKAFHKSRRNGRMGEGPRREQEKTEGKRMRTKDIDSSPELVKSHVNMCSLMLVLTTNTTKHYGSCFPSVRERQCQVLPGN